MTRPTEYVLLDIVLPPPAIKKPYFMLCYRPQTLGGCVYGMKVYFDHTFSFGGTFPLWSKILWGVTFMPGSPLFLCVCLCVLCALLGLVLFTCLQLVKSPQAPPHQSLSVLSVVWLWCCCSLLVFSFCAGEEPLASWRHSKVTMLVKRQQMYDMIPMEMKMLPFISVSWWSISWEARLSWLKCIFEKTGLWKWFDTRASSLLWRLIVTVIPTCWRLWWGQVLKAC